eukprot:g749.t1
MNLYAEVSKLRERQAELDAQGGAAKKKQKRAKNPTSKPSPTTPAKRKKELLRADIDSSRESLVTNRLQRPSGAISIKSRKFRDPLNKRLKEVITCLLETREAMTKDAICKKTKQDAEDRDLWDAVHKNPRIEVLENGQFLYKPQFQNVRNKEDLLMHIRRHPKGTLWEEISDTYKSVEQDLAELQNEYKIFVIENPDIEDKVIFWNDPKIERAKISDQVLDLWKDSQPPPDNHVYETALKKSGIKLSIRKTAQKREPVEKRRKPRKSRDFKYRKITNTHMPELFASSQPEQID